MTVDLMGKSWFMKYAPKTAEELIFDSDEHKSLVSKWIQNEKLDGNVLLYGPPGLGKTVTAELLIRTIVKVQNDVHIAKDRNVKEIREIISPFVTKRAVRSKQKIVYIEECDKMHPDAVNILKFGLMEKYQDSCMFLSCTNYIQRIESALLQRYTYKIPFSGKNTEGVTKRLIDILNLEKIPHDPNALKQFVEKNHRAGIREMINQLQIASMSLQEGETLDLENIAKVAGIEQQVIDLFIKMNIAVTNLDSSAQKTCYILPLNSPIAEDYQQFYTLLHNNYDINYDAIFTRLYEQTRFTPAKAIIARYADGNKFKMFPSENVLSCFAEVCKCIAEIKG